MPVNQCDDNPVAQQYQLGQELGVRGTPAMITETGQMIPGYQSADELMVTLGLNSLPASYDSIATSPHRFPPAGDQGGICHQARVQCHSSALRVDITPLKPYCSCPFSVITPPLWAPTQSYYVDEQFRRISAPSLPMCSTSLAI